MRHSVLPSLQDAGLVISSFCEMLHSYCSIETSVNFQINIRTPYPSFKIPRHRMWRLIGPWWRHLMETFSALLALFAGELPVTGEFPSKDQWRGALMFSLICVWINGWVNNPNAGDLRRQRVNYDVTIMTLNRNAPRLSFSRTTRWSGSIWRPQAHVTRCPRKTKWRSISFGGSRNSLGPAAITAIRNARALQYSTTTLTSIQMLLSRTLW